MSNRIILGTGWFSHILVACALAFLYNSGGEGTVDKVFAIFFTVMTYLIAIFWIVGWRVTMNMAKSLSYLKRRYGAFDKFPVQVKERLNFISDNQLMAMCDGSYAPRYFIGTPLIAFVAIFMNDFWMAGGMIAFALSIFLIEHSVNNFELLLKQTKTGEET